MSQRGVGPGGVERVRREAQLAALRYDEERQKTRSLQRCNVTSYTKVLAAPHHYFDWIVQVQLLVFIIKLLWFHDSNDNFF